MPDRKPGQPARKVNVSGAWINNPTYQLVKRQRRQRWIHKYKKAKGCEHCGYNEHAVALDFDHVDPQQKDFNPSARSLLVGLKRLIAEIRKCRVLCANCHRVETFRSKQFNNRHL